MVVGHAGRLVTATVTNFPTPPAGIGATPQQRAAADPRANVWVAASAGSGKTRVLVDRLLRLMLDGAPPQRLLCLTFTKAAAAEMANRLHGELARWTMLDDTDLREALTQLMGPRSAEQDLATARRLFARVLDTPGGLKIQTIHAFCESLLGRFPLEAGLSPQFQVMEERTAAELLEDARNEVITIAREEPDSDLAGALVLVSEYVGEIGFADVVLALAGTRGKLRRVIDSRDGIDGLIEATRHNLGVADGDTHDSVLAAACADEAFDGPSLRRAAAALQQSSPRERERGEVLAHWLEKDDARADNFDEYTRIYLTRQGDIRARLAIKATQAIEPDAKDILGTEAQRIVRVMDRLNAVALADRTAALIVLGDALLRAYEEQKRRHNFLDYDDLILHARALLSRPGVAPWVLYKLDGGIDHILIDEAQDTSPDQWDVAAALAEEFFSGQGAREAARTVFVVGDEKQSIYSFQGADPAAFEEMRQHFRARVEAAQEKWQPVALLRSFRSTPAILSAVDAIFQQDEARAGVTAGEDSIKHESSRMGQAGLVELWPTITDDGSVEVNPWEPPMVQETAVRADTRLTERIAGRIKHWLRNSEMLLARGRPVRPGDIMILVRRRNDFFEDMVRTLKQWGIPVAGTDRMILSDQLAIMDLVALGRFVLLPEDDLTLAIVLKGPLFGFDDSRLFDLAYDRGRARLWDRLRDRRAEADDFAAAYERLAALLAVADFISPFEFFAGVLSQGGRKQILGRLGPEANDPLDEFLARALAFERDHAPSLERFLHWLEAGAAEVKRDLEQGNNQVRVMTVHGAKGLEAPIVFLPDTCATPQEREPLLWADGADNEPFLLWPVRKALEERVSRAARAAERKRRDEEYRRLLYVALTRAEDRLYICGWETSRGRGEGCWYDLAANGLQGLGHQVEVDFGGPEGLVRVLRVEQSQTAPAQERKPTVGEHAPVKPLPDWASSAPPDDPAPAKPLAPSRPVADEPTVQAPLGANSRARYRRGKIIHHLLQTLPDLPRDARAQAARAFIARPVYDFDDTEQKEIVSETLAVLDEPRFRRLFDPGALAEAPIAGVVGGYSISGQIDRLVVEDDEVLIVDYKTNRSPPDREEDVPAAYLHQMAAYRAALSRIYPDRPVRCALLWTQGPKLMELSDSALDRAAP